MRFLFQSSKEFQDGVTNTFHFVNTLRVAMEQLSGGVRRMVDAGADDRVLTAFYSPPTGATGQNIRQFASKSDADQDAELASIWLFTAIAHYEVWADQLPVPSPGRGAQFPSMGYSPNSVGRGYNESFGTVQIDHELASIYSDSLNSDPNHLGSRVDDALVLYRLYKEIRNSLTHEGGEPKAVALQLLEEAQEKAEDLHSHASGDLILLPQLSSGIPIALSLEQVRCFVNLLMRLVFTLDANLLLSNFGRVEILDRLHTRVGEKPLYMFRRKVSRWVAVEFANAGVPTPPDVPQIIPFLETANVLRTRTS